MVRKAKSCEVEIKEVKDGLHNQPDLPSRPLWGFLRLRLGVGVRRARCPSAMRREDSGRLLHAVEVLLRQKGRRPHEVGT